ncbi:MAG: DsbA family protein [Nitrosospira sp.]
MSEKILWYIADPMCSWCWGFAPVIETIRHEYGGRLKVELLLGGLRPGTKDPMTSTQREEILRHWRTVQRTTGQPFCFEGAMPEGFIYDTEPASRGVVVVSSINPKVIFPFFKAVQSAFYVEQLDVTNAAVLMQLAANVRLNAQRFLEIFESDTAKKRTLDHFNKARQWGVHGFPTVVMQNAAGYSPLTSGYRSFEELRPQLDEWLEI